MSKVYALLDSNKRITAIDGGITTGNIQNISEWTLIDEGDGTKYDMCQSCYLDSPIKDERGVCQYKYYQKKVTKRTKKEMDDDWNNRPPDPLSDIDMLKKQVEAQNAILDFYEECIAEMAEVVYA